MPILPSVKQIEENKPKFPLLPQDDYILKVEAIEPTVQMNFTGDEEIEVMKTTFSIVSLKDGSVATDVNGQKIDERRRMLRDFDEHRMGFTNEGLPSLTRQFVSYMLGVSPFEENENFDFKWDDFVGKTIAAKIVQYKIKKGKNAGQIGNKIDEFLPPKRKTFEEQIKDDDIPIIEKNNGLENGEIDPKDIPF